MGSQFKDDSGYATHVRSVGRCERRSSGPNSQDDTKRVRLYLVRDLGRSWEATWYRLCTIWASKTSNYKLTYLFVSAWTRLEFPPDSNTRDLPPKARKTETTPTPTPAPKCNAPRLPFHVHLVNDLTRAVSPLPIHTVELAFVTFGFISTQREARAALT